MTYPQMHPQESTVLGCESQSSPSLALLTTLLRSKAECSAASLCNIPAQGGEMPWWSRMDETSGMFALVGTEWEPKSKLPLDKLREGLTRDS